MPEWGPLIQAQPTPTPIVANLYLGAASQSASAPQKFECGSGNDLYAVKFQNNKHGDGRALVAEHLAGRCGDLIGAPVGKVSLIDVGEYLVGGGLITLQDGMPVVSGLQHGSRWEEPYGDRKDIQYVDENHERLGVLQVLYTWLLCTADHQLLYRDDPPHDVLSVDHSEMLPGPVGAWTPDLLSASADSVQLDGFFSPAGLGSEDRRRAAEALAGVTDEAIAEAVAGPPSEWGLDEVDRIALAGYLATRRVRLLEILS